MPVDPGQGIVPDGWKAVRLEDVAEVNPRRPKLEISDETSVTFLPMAAIAENCRGVLKPQICPYSEVSNGYTYFENCDTLIAKITPCLENGKHFLASGLELGFGFGTTEFHVVRATKGITPRFLFRVLIQPRNLERYAKNFTGTAGQQRVQPDALKSTQFLLPPIREQRAIAEILDSIDESIERTEAVIAATEKVRDSLLNELLTCGMPGWHTEWRDVPGIGTIPASWEVVRLGEVAEVIMGQSPPGANVLGLEGVRPDAPGLPFIQGNAEFGERVPAPVKWCVKPLKVALPGDTLVSVRAPVGDTNRVESPLAIGRGLSAIRFRDLDPIYGWHLISNVSNVFERVAQGSTFTAIGGQQLRELPIPSPSCREQRTIASLMDGVDDAIVNQRSELELLQLFKASTADALLTGQVRVGKEHDPSNGTSE
ncbi:MAG: restriction endonuclease subunit S [Chloroflexi bacterium]|nr:restriction endonuclease subunit S [Chloroflexota bacterium]